MMRICSGFVVCASLLLLVTFGGAALGQSQDAAYQTPSAWDEEANGPLPRVREGGTPPVDPEQRLTPYAVDLSGALQLPSTGLVEAPPEYAPVDGVLFRYSSGAWPVVVTDLVAGLTGDPTDDEIAYVIVSNSSQQSIAQSQFSAAGDYLSKLEYNQMPPDSI